MKKEIKYSFIVAPLPPVRFYTYSKFCLLIFIKKKYNDVRLPKRDNFLKHETGRIIWSVFNNAQYMHCRQFWNVCICKPPDPSTKNDYLNKNRVFTTITTRLRYSVLTIYLLSDYTIFWNIVNMENQFGKTVFRKPSFRN